jgi:hypothetical protein
MDEWKPEYENEWSKEIARRIHELKDGTVTTIPWSKVRKNCLDRIAGTASRAQRRK